MRQSYKILIFTVFCCLSLVALCGEAYAADVLETVRDKAAYFIKNLRPLIFILAGFGLIGFAFGAIFGKISWKWFANIAIGLFLVANVGLFVDYFASKSGAKGTYSEKLGYGKYLDASGSYTATPGSSSDPTSQKDPGTGGDGTTDNSTSDDISENCVPGTGTGCSSSGKESGSETVVNTQEGCSAAGGLWMGTSCVLPEEETPDEAPLPGTGFENVYDADGGMLDGVVVTAPDLSGNKQSNLGDLASKEGFNLPTSGSGSSSSSSTQSNLKVPSNEQMNALAEKAKEQYDSTGKIDMNQLLRDEVAAGRMTEEQAAQAGSIFTEVANSKGGNVGAAINDVLKGSKEQMEEEKAAANNDMASSAGNIGNLYDQIINEETPDEEPLPGTGFENIGGSSGGYRDNASGFIGGIIGGATTGIINEETPDEEALPGTGFENVNESISNDDILDDEIVEEQIEDEAEINCAVLESDCKDQYNAALQACEDGTKRMTQKEWCEKNPSKCAYKEGEYDITTAKPIDSADYKKYIDELYEEKRECERARMDECPFDKTPSEATYCERYPSRCTEVKSGTQKYSGMYPNAEGSKEYTAYAQKVSENKRNIEQCKKEAGLKADACYAPCANKY